MLFQSHSVGLRGQYSKIMINISVQIGIYIRIQNWPCALKIHLFQINMPNVSISICMKIDDFICYIINNTPLGF